MQWLTNDAPAVLRIGMPDKRRHSSTTLGDIALEAPVAAVGDRGPSGPQKRERFSTTDALQTVIKFTHMRTEVWRFIKLLGFGSIVRKKNN